MKFYAGENVDAAVVEGLRHRGIDIPTTREAGTCAASDEDQVAFALRQDRSVLDAPKARHEEIDGLRLESKV